VVFAAVYERTTGRYGQRGRRYVHMDAGHAGQNVCLQAEALHLGTVVVGAFDDRRVRAVLGLPEGQEPLSIMPIGRR
jgi:SagB-type dehydrogenase family enzyme